MVPNNISFQKPGELKEYRYAYVTFTVKVHYLYSMYYICIINDYQVIIRYVGNIFTNKANLNKFKTLPIESYHSSQPAASGINYMSNKIKFIILHILFYFKLDILDSYSF